MLSKAEREMLKGKDCTADEALSLLRTDAAYGLAPEAGHLSPLHKSPTVSST